MNDTLRSPSLVVYVILRLLLLFMFNFFLVDDYEVFTCRGDKIEVQIRAFSFIFKKYDDDVNLNVGGEQVEIFLLRS